MDAVRPRALAQLTNRVDDFRARLPEESPSFSPQVGRALTRLLDLASLERILVDQELRHPRATMARNGRALPPSAYTNAGRSKDGTLVNASLVGRELAAGASLMIVDLISCWRPVADFCRRLSYELGRPVSAGSVLTPAGAQGFSHHYDLYSIFAVQLMGRKTWQLCRPTWPLPLESVEQSWQGGRHLDEDERLRIKHGDPDVVVEMQAGDVLWLPRGWIHNVFATDEPSLHLTLNVYGQSRHTLTKSIVDILGREEGFRQALPVEFLRSAGSAAREILGQVTERIATLDPDEVARAAVDRIRASWYPPRSQPLLEAFLTDEHLARFSGVVTVREAVLSMRRTPDGRLDIDTGQRQLMLEPAAAGLVEASLRADDGGQIPLARLRSALGHSTVATLKPLLGAGIATLVGGPADE
jgi:hypothetical protein